jgi:hypothetical protein
VIAVFWVFWFCGYGLCGGVWVVVWLCFYIFCVVVCGCVVFLVRVFTIVPGFLPSIEVALTL